jgi:DnaJ-class molecular chaperone
VTHYQTLKLSENATPAEIKSAWRTLAKESHPDSGGDAAMFSAYKGAYDVLKDPKQKAKYDATLFAKKTTASYGFARGRAYTKNTFYETFTDFKEFKDTPKPKARPQDKAKATQQPKAPKEKHISIPLSLKEHIEGCEKNIKLKLQNGHTSQRKVTIPPGMREGSKMKITLPGIILNLEFTLKTQGNFQIKNGKLWVVQNLTKEQFQNGGDVFITDPTGQIHKRKIPSGVETGRTTYLEKAGLLNADKKNRDPLHIVFYAPFEHLSATETKEEHTMRPASFAGVTPSAKTVQEHYKKAQKWMNA